MLATSFCHKLQNLLYANKCPPPQMLNVAANESSNGQVIKSDV